MTRIFLIAGTFAIAALCGGWAGDRQGPYCLYEHDSTNCGFPSFQACWASASGVGGFCAENPRYVAAAEPRQPRRQRNYR